jgi:two-component system chemotaxis response regulator CheY
MKVLVVDDAAFMRTILRKILTEGGHTVIEAGGGIEALDRFAVEQPDMVTMDITMTGMDGIETIRQLRARHPQARVVMCSAMGQETLVLQAIQAGALDFIVKPFKAARVLDSIQRAAAKALA